MKKIYIVLMILSMGGFAKAQEELPAERKQQEIEALKIAFITKELELTTDEAQKFWPAYNQYAKELKTTLRDEADVLARDEKVLNVRKRYKDQFANILGQPRMNRFFNAEGKFRQLLIKSMRNQNLRNRPNRPLQRRGN
ncbi:MAG: hypothetical protein WKI04_19780 [Ferruginibacter sp.]